MYTLATGGASSFAKLAKGLVAVTKALGDDFVRTFIKSYGDDAVKAIAAHGDDMGKLALHSTDDAAKLLLSSSDDVGKAALSYTDDAGKTLLSSGDDMIDDWYGIVDDTVDGAAKSWDDVANSIDDVADDALAGKPNTGYNGSTIEGAGDVINPNEIRFSQSSVNGADEITTSMKANGWLGEPIDVVKMPDGELSTLDKTRVVAARQAGIDAKAIVHGFNDPLPNSLVSRFTTPKGVPETWGEALNLRIGKQNSTFRYTYPSGSFDLPNINNK